MLKPDVSDPNYKDQMKQYDKDSAPWGPGGAMPIPMSKAPEAPKTPEGKEKK